MCITMLTHTSEVIMIQRIAIMLLSLIAVGQGFINYNHQQDINILKINQQHLLHNMRKTNSL